MNLSKAFGTWNHDLLIVKFSGYDLEYSYIINRRHRTKVNSVFSSWEELTQRVPHGSVLGHLLFNIYLQWSIKPFWMYRSV